MTRKGIFIVIEGIDGSGSTTQSVMVEKFLKSAGIKAHVTREPTNYLIGGLIRSWLTGDWSSSSICLQLLFTADRAHHLEKEIIPTLRKGTTVVCDRYYYSTIAYGSLEIPDTEWLIEINKHFLKPDLVIYLRVSPEDAMRRLRGSRNSLEIFEKIKHLARVAEQYENFVSRLDYMVAVDGSPNSEEVFGSIKAIIGERLGIK